MAVSASPSPFLLLKPLSFHSIPHLFIPPTIHYPLSLRSPPPRTSTIAFGRRKKSSIPTARTKLKKTTLPIDDREGDDIGEDAFEALFSQLEEDLKNDNISFDEKDGNDIDDDAFEALFTQLEKDLANDNLSDDDDDETTEDPAKLEQELEGVLGDDDDGESPGAPSLNSDDEPEEEEKPLKLKNWQLRRLARAVKVGRRKTSIKVLSAELGLDRALVLELLRNPPPNLLLLSATLPDEVAEVPPEPSHKPIESPISSPIAKSKPEAGVPVHVMQSRWSLQKRLKKVQVETLERVYARTKRPTNAMISSIVHVTNLPSKRVVQWFEEKRVEDGVPEQRLPFRRSMPEPVSTT